MPVRTDIFARHNLALFTYWGEVTYAEAIAAVATVARHPDHHDTMRQLCCLAEVTGVEQDFAAQMKMQARMAEDLLPRDGEKLVVFHAPTRLSRTMAQLSRKSWDGLNAVVVRVVEREDHALALLGVPVTRIEDLYRIGA